MEQNEELNILEKIALGDHSAFRQIFMKYYPKTKYFITRIVKSEVVAEELSQDIFEKVWRNKTEMIHLRSFNSYIYRLAKNISINYLEHKYVEDTYILNYNFKQDFSIPAEEELNAKEVKMLIQLEVERMPEQRKKIFLMSRIQYLKNDEIAQKLNISKKTVENHLNLALKQIRQVITTLSILFFL